MVMEKRILGKTGLEISAFAFGGIVVRDTPQDEANRIVIEAIGHGINYFDVAPSYGNAQNILGPAIAPHRSKIYLACKTEKRTRAEAQAALEESFKLLHTDYFDVYQLHGVDPSEVDTVLGKNGALEVLVEAKKKGLVRNIGLTTHHDSVALKLMATGVFDTILFPINWACWIKNGLGQEALKEAARQNMGRVAIKGLAKWAKEPKDDGYPKCWYSPIYDDPELAELALRFTMPQDVHTAVSPGDVRMLRLGISIVEKYNGKVPPLTNAELEELTRRAKLVEHTVFAPAA
ncbi:oxidoreductase [Spirochaetia bacterium]|nr:oxidoreductase [Spirochaetia bacterium]